MHTEKPIAIGDERNWRCRWNIAVLEKRNAQDSRMPFLQHSKTTLKKERPDKKSSPDHSHGIIEDYRIANQSSKKNTAKSPSPKRVKVGRNTSPFVA